MYRYCHHNMLRISFLISLRRMPIYARHWLYSIALVRFSVLTRSGEHSKQQMLVESGNLDEHKFYNEVASLPWWYIARNYRVIHSRVMTHKINSGFTRSWNNFPHPRQFHIWQLVTNTLFINKCLFHTKHT